MTEARAGTSARTASEAPHPVEVDLELAPGASLRAVGRLVAGGVAARLGMRVDRVEELQLAIDAALQREASGGALRLTFTPHDDELQVRLGPFAGRGRGLRGVERVLSALVDEVEIREAERDAWLAMRVSRGEPAPAGS